MTNLIRAPWTPEQVAALNAFQRRSGVHPFTCGGEHTPGSPRLIAREDGWHCSDPYQEGCDYRQDWAHAFMAELSRPVIEHALTVYFDGNAELARTLIDRLLAEEGGTERG